MAGELQPLVSNQRIVREDGTPTDYFVRWAQDRQIDITGSITAAQALAIVEKFTLDHPLIPGSGILLTPSGNIADDVTIAADAQAILDQISDVQGSVLFRGAADWQALAPGAAGQFLKTNGAGADPAWAAAGGGGGGSLVKIDQVVVAVASNTITFAAIPNTYEDLIIAFHGQLNSPNVDFVWASLNGDTAVHYEYSRAVLQNSGPAYANATSTGLAAGLVGGAVAGASYADSFETTIYSYARAAFYKQSMSRNTLRFGAALNTITHENFISNWLSTAVVNAVALHANSGNFTVGSVATIYGRG